MAFADWARAEETTAYGHASIGPRKIYILPTRYGWIFAALLFLMLLGAVNYGNNPAHLLTFLLAGLAANAIYQTWRNLRGLELRMLGAPPVFAGRPASYRLQLRPGDRERPAIQFGFVDGAQGVVDLDDGRGDKDVQLPLGALPRGHFEPGRLVVSTRYPLGLFCAWCYVDNDIGVVVYPSPGARWQAPGATEENANEGRSGTGDDDFNGLRPYQPGDQSSRIDWKSLARDRGLHTRQFCGATEAPCWLDWEDAPGADVEQKLSALSRAVIDADAAGHDFGLRLPGAIVEPDRGARQRHRCLRQLAHHGLADA